MVSTVGNRHGGPSFYIALIPLENVRIKVFSVYGRIGSLILVWPPI